MNHNKEVCEIEIKNFREFHPRKDYKSMPWVKIDCNIFDDHIWAVLPPYAMSVWIRLLTVCGRSNDARVTFAIRLVAVACRLKPFQVTMLIDRLEELRVLTVHSRSWAVRVTSPSIGKVKLGKVSKEDTFQNPKIAEKENLTAAENSGKLDSSTQNSKKKPPITKATWESYSHSYRKRYGADPLQNRTTNSQMKSFVERVGVEEAPAIAEYFLSLNDPWYTKQAHSVGNLLRDAEKIRTLWATGRRTTEVSPKTAHYQNQFQAIERGEI